MKIILTKAIYFAILLVSFCSCQKEMAEDIEEIYERGASQVSFSFNISAESAINSWRNPQLMNLKSELPDSVMLTYVKVKGPHGNPDGLVHTSRTKIYLTPSGLKSASFYMNPGWYKLIDVELKANDGNIIALGANGNEDIKYNVPDGEAMGKYFVVEPFSKPNIQTWVLPSHNKQLLGFSYTPKSRSNYLNIPILLSLSGDNGSCVLQTGEICLYDARNKVIDKNILISGSKGWIYISRNVPKEIKQLYIQYIFADKVICSDSIDISTQIIPLMTDNTVETYHDFQLFRTVAFSNEAISR